jgi:hypothetical protein
MWDDLDYYNDFLVEEQSKLNTILSESPFEMRRKHIKWKQVLDRNKNVLKKPIFYKICDMTLQQLHDILKEVDYDNDTNYDITLRTIWEEYHSRKNKHL